MIQHGRKGYLYKFTIGLLRKIREYQWGHCKTKSMLNGKVFIVTGANSGIGKETVRELARRKARVVMACRDLDKTKQVIEDIRREISSGELSVTREFTLFDPG
ncbi:hypothetical protein ANN_14892 [Periplaneta americana]|uniref:Uncharacterized protein n=1 Tax=Periplaneta americana TaxID=6978 RepID=A0ABQ8SY59_PERAM|nr:hypothetical protein ANN_14892 [Periplaneta americana]